MPNNTQASKKGVYKGPDLDRFIEERKKTYVSYSQGARMYSMNYYAFVKLAKQAGANQRIKKNVVVNLDLVEEYLEKYCKVDGEDNNAQKKRT